MTEFRLQYIWGNHWTVIHSSDNPSDMIEHILNRLPEMADAMNGTKHYFAIVQYINNNPRSSWHGTPEELLEVIKEISDSWLSLASQ